MSSTLKRVVGPALVAGLVVTSVATPAAAQAPGSTAFRLFGSLAVLQARAGVANQVTATVSGTHLILTDTTGIAVGPGCTRLSPNTADCGAVTSLAVQLGDGNDTFDGSTAPINTTVDAGTGIDKVTTGSGNDTIGVQDNAPGDNVDCGGGSADTAFRDTGDTVTNCERVF
ncbi:hypothetical protein [Streptomyces barringtoniae]|uniref:hypothetical protein n=1 Tax=Streptomyces barringtoniae TaxID=2892029 RepID=UPI001E5A7FA8|nr:hypothetical protein [Streptomyces barringtoniae]MCC5476787.1 hypothetical protein [Streptomyces barringtoniae]